MTPPRALKLLAGLLAVYLAAPFASGLGQISRADWRGLDPDSLARATAVSVASATLATALVALGGIPLAYLLARTPGRLMVALGFVVQLPLALPPLASGILLLFLIGYASPLGALTGGALTDSLTGIVLAEAFVAAPFLIIAARTAFASIDPALEDVAATLGHRPWAVFRRVDLALAWRGILAGLLLTWLRAFGEFGATVMVAYHPYSLPVFTYVEFGSQGLPAMLPVLLPTLLAAIVVMAATQRIATPPIARPPADMPAAEPRPTRPPISPAAPESLAFNFRWRRDGFALDVGWRTDAARLCILGASGSGKSATLRLIAGLDHADSAMLSLGGQNIARQPPYARGLAYVPQNFGLLAHLPVSRQVRFSVGCDEARAAYWTGRLGLAGLEHRRPAELSLGQQQRVALARALARPSRLLLLDEPLSALDAPLRAQLRDELRALQREFDATTILVTHDPAEAILLADELLLLDNGRVLQSGPVEAVFLRPINAAAARLLGAQNIAAGHAVGPHQIDLGGVLIAVDGPALSLGPIGLAVRPDAVRVGAGGSVPGLILDTGTARAGRRRLTVRVAAATLRASYDPGQNPAPGPCRVSIDPSALQIWPTTAA